MSTQDSTIDVIRREGFMCDDCGHRHQGARFAFICIGCACPKTVPRFMRAPREVPTASVNEEP